MSITGTWASVESPDQTNIGGGIGTLGEIFTARLLQRDRPIWLAAHKRQQCFSLDDDDGVDDGGAEPTKNEQRRKPGPDRVVTFVADAPCRKCGAKVRYISTGECTNCARVRNRTIKQAKRAARKLATDRKPVSRPALRSTQVRVVKKVEPRDPGPSLRIVPGPAHDRWSDQ